MNISEHSGQLRKMMEFKNYSKNSIKNYVSCFELFLSHFEKIGVTHPDRINAKEIVDYLLNYKEINTRRNVHSAVKLYYDKVSRNGSEKFRYIEYSRKERKLPIPLDSHEIQLMINGCDNLKHKAILVLMYATGMRIGEIINLKLCDIDRSRMVIYIKQGKGNKDRTAPMHNDLLKLLEKYYREHFPKTYLFNGQTKEQYTAKSIQTWIKELGKKVGIKKDIYPHLIRHSFGTNMVEQGVDMSIIQKMLGHANIKTTHLYAQISTSVINRVASPLNQIQL